MCKCFGWLTWLVVGMSASTAWAQFGGSRAGVEGGGQGISALPRLEREIAESYITIDGRAEIRVRPTELRVVLAITSDGATAQECQQSISATLNGLRAAWKELGIPAENMVEDFIAVLPVYEWSLEKRNNTDVGIERRTGFRMQSNLHLAIPNDATAAAALKAAFEQGVTDIIAFDYWSRELDETKKKAREQAVQAARDKADTLLGALFEERPSVINLQEQTTIRYPESLYHSFENSVDADYTPSWRRDVPFIRAHRPKNTYYRGLYTDGDIQARELPMHPEISVVSTVRLYFASPAAGKNANPMGIE